MTEASARPKGGSSAVDLQKKYVVPSPHLQPQSSRRARQLEKLLADPSKPAFIPPPPQTKTLRPPREMIKNVQGSSAGAGSGEFHVYKQARRREYERLKIMEEEEEQVGGTTRSPLL